MLGSLVSLDRIRPEHIFLDPEKKQSFVILPGYAKKPTFDIKEVLKTSVTLKMMPKEGQRGIAQQITINTDLQIDPKTKDGLLNLAGFNPARFANMQVIEINVIISKTNGIQRAA